MSDTAYLIVFINPKTLIAEHAGIFSEARPTARIGPNAPVQAVLYQIIHEGGFAKACEQLEAVVRAVPNLFQLCERLRVRPFLLKYDASR